MELKHIKLESFLKQKQKFAPVYLIYGDELLYKEAFKKLLNNMVLPEQQGLNYEPLDGKEILADPVAASLATYPMFPGTKVVAWHDSRVFYSQKQIVTLLEKAKMAHGAPDINKAARYVLDFLSIQKMEIADLDPIDPMSSLKLSAEDSSVAGSWLGEVLSHCIKEKLKVPKYMNQGEIIIQALDQGCPDNHLVITAEIVDKRKRLYKFIKEKGVIIDCSIPKGNIKADKDAQIQALRAQMDRILLQRKKIMEPRAFDMLADRIGADLRAFSTSLDKLCSYIGDRKKITAADVKAAVKRTKQDPIFEFTGALAEKNADQAFAYLDRLLAADFHPLAVLAASANHMRRFLAIKIFLSGPYGDRWKKGMNFNAFKSGVMPAITGHDAKIDETLSIWESQLIVEEDSPQKTKKDKKKFKSDLLIAPKTRNPYPIYLAFKNSSQFTQAELFSILKTLLQADRDIKSTPQQRARLIMETVIFSICKSRT